MILINFDSIASSSLPLARLGRAQRAVVGIFFLGLAGVLFLPYLWRMPEGIHVWAQADRLALALNYFDQGMQFWRPRTFNLMPYDGVTGVEFPLLPYLAALLGKVFGREAIMPIFRMLTIACSVTGCYYLFLLVYERSGRFLVSLLPGVFVLTSPIFAYYTGNFLPDAPGAALTFVAYYYFFRYHQQRRFGNLAVAILLFTLATLTKTSAGTYLVGAGGITLLLMALGGRRFLNRQKAGFLVLILLSFVAVMGYVRFTKYLNEVFLADIFLDEARPITSLYLGKEVVRHMVTGWWPEYFTPVHTALLLASLLVVISTVRWSLRHEPLLLSQVGLTALGCAAYFCLMGAQLIAHDYYVLSAFMPFVVLVLVLALLRMVALPWSRTALNIALAGLAAGMLVLGMARYQARMSDYYPPFSQYYNYQWMRGGAQLLDAAGVPARATILVAGDAAPNVGLLYFNRRGLVGEVGMVTWTSEMLSWYMQTHGLGYVVMRRDDYHQRRASDPAFPIVLEVVAQSAAITVLRPRLVR